MALSNSNTNTSIFRPFILDFCGFGFLLAALNFWAAPGDAVWLSANPSPWLLLPVYLGCRYGIAA